MYSFPKLTTERLVLREFRESDAPAVFDLFSRESVTKYHNLETMCSLEQAEELVKMRSTAYRRALGIRWAIAVSDRPETVIGSCGFYNLNRWYRIIEIGYDLHPDYWRRGIMTEALTSAINFGFGEGFSERFSFIINRIEAMTCLDHVASIGVLRKLGFREEGIRREYGYWKGAFHDLRGFALLRREWASLKAAGNA